MLQASPDFDLQLRRAAQAYRLIDEQDQAAVVVPYLPAGGQNQRATQALAALQAGTADRWAMRVLQRLVVQVRAHEVLAELGRDFVEPMPGWFVLTDHLRYSARFGLIAGGAALDAQSLVQ
jgi:CRISPR-associated endonuclease/helicase Cas3